MQTYKKVVIICVALSVLIILLYIYFFFLPKKEKKPEPAKPPRVQETLPDESQDTVESLPEETEYPKLEIPLKKSDKAVREVLKKCSSHPLFLKWLKNEELVRTFVAVVDGIARGDNPAPLLEFLKPKEKFKTTPDLNFTKVNPSGYKRYTPLIEGITSIKNDTVSTVYLQLKSLIDNAYKELGYPEGGFENTLIKAINVILKTPIVEGDIYLEKKVISYYFRDLKLEQLLPVQKLLIRMGPANTRKIHAKLRAIAEALKITPGKLVRSTVYKTK